MRDLSKRGMFFLPFLLAAGVLLLPVERPGDARVAMAKPLATPVSEKPQFAAYKGVSIGTPAAEVRTKLGKPAVESDPEDNFTISDTESARVFYDEAKTVRAISIMYTGDLKLAPTPKSIVGTDIPPKPDGGMHKTVQYPRSGFWVSFVRTGGDDAIIIITMQKMAKES